MTDVVLEARDVHCSFKVSTGFMRPKRLLRAVNGVSLNLRAGESVGLVGESGCGKTTVAMMLLGLIRPARGEVRLDGLPMHELDQRDIARRVQPIFQDPYSSLNPRKRIADIIALPLRVHRMGSTDDRRKKVVEMMDMVGLSPRYADSYPDQLSGGQRQRVAIARALIMRPRIVICDEPTSSLDVSMQSQILNLLLDLQRELGLAYLLISHNLAVVEHMAVRAYVMYLGRVVEETDSEQLFRAPAHPYTRALLASVLTPEPGRGVPDTHLGVAYANSIDPPSGCTFHPRCTKAMAVCSTIVPHPVTHGATRHVECHLYSEAPNPAPV
ncbi:MAG: ATP-binding cassette domain-containing protein [Rhodospirillales bacterium]|nr:ATP-binding cassette domain-containing protein [Rhodospirillales bacterium]